MKNSKFAKFAFAAFSIFLIFDFSGCKKNKNLESQNSEIPVPAKQKEPALLKKLDDETKSYLEEKNIIVVLGYGYNNEDSIEKITQNLAENFGVETEENSGLISIFVYPDDFMTAGKARVSSFVNLLEDKNPAGILILGAPEGMYIALSKLQDQKDNGKLEYPVFSFFSQDDVLGSEATSDFVLDYAHKSETLAAETQMTDFISDFDVASLLDSAVSAMITLRAPLKSDENLEEFVKSLFKGKKNISHYIDGETGLQSINHFIFD